MTHNPHQQHEKQNVDPPCPSPIYASLTEDHYPHPNKHANGVVAGAGEGVDPVEECFFPRGGRAPVPLAARVPGKAIA